MNYNEVEKFKDLGGIRIEEDLAITTSGIQLLRDPLAKTARHIEALKTPEKLKVLDDRKACLSTFQAA